MGPRFPSRVSPARPVAAASPRGQPSRVHGDCHCPRASRYRDAARSREPDRIRGFVRSSQPDLSCASARRSQEAADGGARPPSPRGRHHLLHVAPRGGCAGGVADRHRTHCPPVSRGPFGRRTQPPPGRVPQRARRHHRRNRGIWNGHRSLGRPLRRSRRLAAIARALPAGVRPCGARRTRS